MKYCLTSRVKISTLKEVDEIKVSYADRRFLLNLLIDEKDSFVDQGKTFIIENKPEDESVNFQELEEYKILSKDNLTLCLSKVADMREAQNLGYKFYAGYPARTFSQLHALIKLGASEVIVEDFLFFHLHAILEMYPKIKIRVVPNVAYTDGFPRPSGLFGSWIRPETLSKYEDLISVVEFGDCESSPTKERALYNIYKTGVWNGDLSQIITNLDMPADNRLIKYDERRINCGQSCMEGGTCRICYRSLNLAASGNKIKEYKEKLAKK